MTLQSKLEKIENALTSIEGLKVYHYLRPQLDAPFCVWQEDGESSSLESDLNKEEQALSGSVDLFTLTEYDPLADDIQQALNSIDTCVWALNSVQYEEDTELIHHEWVFSIG